jgi:hypothetical protein
MQIPRAFLFRLSLHVIILTLDHRVMHRTLIVLVILDHIVSTSAVIISFTFRHARFQRSFHTHFISFSNNSFNGRISVAMLLCSVLWRWSIYNCFYFFSTFLPSLFTYFIKLRCLVNMNTFQCLLGANCIATFEVHFQDFTNIHHHFFL